ncbi:thylakoid lumenal 17.4 kDa protein, chloroplastic isoform X1 [Gossypium australe]|uniref:Thylakoid lumenal 17.4 kDa protein, chloroplastic isoform X1 n=1 Tax=Gossypium australe TaxID=47621 RepID=A0A5B6V4G3_9ROSI|nr:thylakoid lumenal 17.4 kDa protein, chloroplastic isoform X1 [Gossypium australe]
MGLIAQTVLMTLIVTINQFASSNSYTVHRKQGKSPSPTSKPKQTNTKTITAEIARRGLILSAVASVPQLNESKTKLLKIDCSFVCLVMLKKTEQNSKNLTKYLKKTEENKAKNDKEVCF